jgi:hypothetical protein
MLDGIFGVLEEQQKQDGEVCRPEFSPNYGIDGWPLLSDPAARQKLETFVLRNCIPEHHRYRLADGSQGVVYFDSRGRATSSRLTEVPDADLMRMADEKRSGFRPETGRKDHGYRGAVQEGKELEEGMKFHVEPKRLFPAMEKAVDLIVKARVAVRDVHELLAQVNQDATGIVWTDNYQNSEISKVAKDLYKLDWDMGDGFRSIESLERKLKTKVVKGGR